MDIKEKQAKRFLEVVSEHYDECISKWKKYQNEKHRDFDIDIFQDTIMSVYDLILRKGIQDDTDEGYLNYFFKSFNINLMREKQYASNTKRDVNADAIGISKLKIDDSGLEDIKMEEAYKQFLTYNTLKIAQDNFDPVTFGCFRLYYLTPKMTYQKLRDVTKVKDCKKRVIQVREYLKEHVVKNELYKRFVEWYDINKNNFW